MSGIISIGAYIPSRRLSAATRDWSGAHPRAIADFDEDAVTMGVAAARDCLRSADRGRVDAVLLGSSSLPYAEKQSCALLATATDLSENLFTADITHSLRSGTQALRMALDGTTAGTYRQALVVASDCRQAAPGTVVETEGGDAAAAVLLGDGPAIAEIDGVHSFVNEIHDVWRPDGESLLRIAPDHFRFEDGFLHSVQQAVAGLLEKTATSISDYDRVIVNAPDARRLRAALGQLGANDAQGANPLQQLIGNAGAADVLLQLAAALDESEPGRRILLVNYGDGADAMALRTTPAIADDPQARRGRVRRLLEHERPLATYLDYLRWRGLMHASDERPGAAPAPNALWRDRARNLRFHGMRCGNCGRVQWPAQRVCAHCRARDRGTSVPLAESAGTLFTYSMDHVAGIPDGPLVHAVVDYDAGTRAMMMMTDRALDEVRIGMRLENVFRKFHYADGIHTYLWKVAPLRARTNES